MDSGTPFQPWTSTEEGVSVKDERTSSGDGKHEKAAPSTSGGAGGSRLAPETGDEPPVDEAAPDNKMSSDRIERMQQIVENNLSAESKQRIMQLLDQVDLLNGAEKLLLYLKLPAGSPILDPLKQPLNPLGSRSEIQQTVMWIQTHLEVDPEVSLPKQDVYDEYIAYCMSTQMKPLSTADFGKVMKQVYPCVRPRRLGTRGNSRYCYAGMRKRVKLEVPQLPELGEKPKTIEIPLVQNELLIAASQLIREWAEKLLNVKFINLCDLAQYLVSKNLVDAGSAMALSMLTTPIDEENRQIPVDSDVGSPSSSKTQRSGVIKELKRKIQSQPQPVPAKFYGKRPKIPSGSDSDNMQPGVSGQPPSPQIKSEVAPSPPEHIVPHSVRSQKPSYPIHKLPDNHGGGLHPIYNASQPYAVNLSQQQPYDARQYYPPNNMESYKLRHEYHESYKYNPYYVQDMSAPHNLSMSGYMNPVYPAPSPPHPSPPHPSAGCHPINLSSSSTQDMEYYKPPPQAPLYNIQPETLNLSVGNKATEWPSEPPPPRPKLPLPGKKQILETYNNETQIQAQTFAQESGKKMISPGKDMSAYSDEYRPKKMRASESFGGKLAAARLASLATATSVPQPPPPHADDFPDSSKDFIVNTMAARSSPLLPSHRGGRGLRKLKMGMRKPEAATDETRPKPGRGRPRKNSLTKAKYTRRQPRMPKPQCSHHCAKSSADCSLGDDAIKMICKEKHSEILTRERVISICNLDKHALDDYLNEGNSQEHEEELMQYFQNNEGETSAQKDGAPPSETTAKPKEKAEKATSDFLDSNLDLHDEHSQGKNEKISQLRELLEKNLVGASSAGLDAVEADPSARINGRSLDFKEGSASASLTLLSQRQQIKNEKPNLLSASSLIGRGLNARRRVSFETPIVDPSAQSANRGGQSVPQSPTYRSQHFSFMPISPGPHSPISNKNSPLGNVKQLSPNKTYQIRATSPDASPFVSPRNTPVPRARPHCQLKPVPNRFTGKKLKGGGFAVPNDQNCPKRNLPMSAPPSPNILMPRYKPCYFNQNNNVLAPNYPQPSSADPLSSEVSQFFSDCLPPAISDPYRSQSAPLNEDLNNSMQYGQRCGNNGTFLSYQNTPCNSIPPTPIPTEFCDFGNLNESISKAGLNSESLDKIYNILDSNPQETVTATANGDLGLTGFGVTSETLDTILQEPQNHTEMLKRSESIEFDLSEISDERRNFSSRSVPSTPLPYRKVTMPHLNIEKYQNDTVFHNFGNDYGKSIISKSVPSTPLIPDDRSVFSYSNRDFLINGNSVEVNVSNSYVDSITPTSDSLKQDFLNETDSLMSNGKGTASILGDMEPSPLQGIVNTELVSFNDDCIGIGPDLQNFNEQGITNENDLLEDLGVTTALYAEDAWRKKKRHSMCSCRSVAEQRARILQSPSSVPEACSNPNRLLTFWDSLGWLE